MKKLALLLALIMLATTVLIPAWAGLPLPVLAKTLYVAF